MTPRLSICIPTYNRAPLVEESLEGLLPQCAGRPVEVCVSNNASTDETAAVLARFPAVRTIAQRSNIGIDRNILAAIRMATGEYVLPIGDDERIRPGGIEAILSALAASPDILIINAKRDCVVTDPREAFALFWDKMPLGGFAIRAEYAAPRLADRYLGTYHAYAGAAWDYLLERKEVWVRALAAPTVEFRQVRKSYADFADEVHFRAIPRWFDLLPALYAVEARRAKREHRRRTTHPRALVHFGVTWLKRHV